MKRALLCLLGGLLLASVGCQTSIHNEGAIDYRMVAVNTNDELSIKYLDSVPGNEDCVIKPGESISIHLQQAFIKDFTEFFGGNPFTRKSTKQGEIAIIIKVYELGEGKDLNFSGDNVRSGRLVYYSSDVRRNQFLNFSQLPVYGPIQYNGRPLILELYLLELDDTKEQSKTLLNQLAKIGAIAYPPSSVALDLLENLGGALLAGSKTSDDVEFRYFAAFSPTGGALKNHALLKAGTYVMVREDVRDNDTQWQKLIFNENEGRLYNSDATSLYRDNTYMVLQINKGLPSINMDLMENTYGNYLNKIDREAIEARGEVDSLYEQWKNKGKGISAFNTAKKYLGEIEKSAETLTSAQIEWRAREVLKIYGNAFIANQKKAKTAVAANAEVTSAAASFQEIHAQLQLARLLKGKTDSVLCVVNDGAIRGRADNQCKNVEEIKEEEKIKILRDACPTVKNAITKNKLDVEKLKIALFKQPEEPIAGVDVKNVTPYGDSEQYKDNIVSGWPSELEKYLAEKEKAYATITNTLSSKVKNLSGAMEATVELSQTQIDYLKDKLLVLVKDDNDAVNILIDLSLVTCKSDAKKPIGECDDPVLDEEKIKIVAKKIASTAKDQSN